MNSRSQACLKRTLCVCGICFASACASAQFVHVQPVDAPQVPPPHVAVVGDAVVGVSVSGYYVREAHSPTTMATAEMLELVRGLVTTLNDPASAPAARQEAQRQLTVLGPDALEPLRQARDGKLEGLPAALSPDAVARIESTIADILDADELGPSRITLDVKDAPIAEVIAQINRQGRANLLPPDNDFGGQAKMRLTMKLDHVSFFQAVDELQKQANITFQANNEGGWRALPGQIDFEGTLGAAVSESGAFRFYPNSANYNRSVSFNRNGGTGDHFSFNFTARAEPKINVSEGQVALEVEEARDDKGNDLLPSGSVANSHAYHQGGNRFSGNIQLRWPKEPGARFVVVKGRMKVNVIRSADTFEIKDVLGTSTTKSFSGVNVTFQSAMDLPNRNGAAVAIAVTLPQAQGNNAVLRGSLDRSLQRARVTDAAGRVLQSNGWDGGVENNVFRYILRYSSADGTEPTPPFSMQVEISRETRTVEVPFDFRDLPMP